MAKSKLLQAVLQSIDVVKRRGQEYAPATDWSQGRSRYIRLEASTEVLNNRLESLFRAVVQKKVSATELLELDIEDLKQFTTLAEILKEEPEFEAALRLAKAKKKLEKVPRMSEPAASQKPKKRKPKA